MRKSPVRHDVGGYTRKDGTKISGYERGRGSHPPKTRRRSKVVGAKGAETGKEDELAFVVNLKYSDKPGDGESVIVLADAPGKGMTEETYKRVLDEAYEERVDPRFPMSVEMVDPDLNAVLQFIGESARKGGKLALKGIKKATKLGAKYAIKGGHIAAQVTVAAGKSLYKGVRSTLKESSKMALYEIERAKVRRMIRDAMSKDPVERKSARVALKLHYPEVYNICHFSRT